MSSKAKFWDKIADKYSRQPVPDEDVYRIKLELTREYLTKQSRVFEFGCGTGSTAIAHAPFVDEILATDVSPRMIEIAKEKAEKADLTNADFDVLDFTIETPNGEPFDMVMAHSILHLVEDPVALVRKSAELMQTGGIFVTSRPCLAEKHWFIKPLVGLMRLVGKAPFVNFFKVKDLENMVRDAGFQIVHHWHPKGSMAVFLIGQKI